MSGSSENYSSHRSGGESDCEGLAASSHESELPDTRTPRRNEQIRGKAWILRGEITTTLFHNDSASMDCDADYGAEVQNVKHETEAALGATFEILFGNKHPNVKVLYLFLQPCQHPACWACSSSNKNPDSNPGFPPNETNHCSNDAR
jgi:hypothetical protein